MATVRANPTLPFLHYSPYSTHTGSFVRIKNWVFLKFHHDGKKNRILASGAASCLPVTSEGVGVNRKEEEEEEEKEGGYLVREFGWGVREMAQVGEEMRMVAQVQAEAFHDPVLLFNDFFFEFFKAEVLAALIYRIRNSPADRYACLVAESTDASASVQAPFERIVGVVDATVQNEKDVLKHLRGDEEYLYVSGIAVLPSFRRQKVATVLLKACEALSVIWRYNYLVLMAYEEDQGARSLYAKAGYEVVSRDPCWITWFGRKQRVTMIKRSPIFEKIE